MVDFDWLPMRYHGAIAVAVPLCTATGLRKHFSAAFGLHDVVSQGGQAEALCNRVGISLDGRMEVTHPRWYWSPPAGG